MKQRLLAAVVLTAVTAVPVLTGPASPVQAVSCNLNSVPVLFPPSAPIVPPPGTPVRVDPWKDFVNPEAGVQCLEDRLVELGYDIDTPDGVYDDTTETAVKQYQLTRGYWNDGVVSPALMRLMGLRGPTPAGPTTPRVTIIGDSTSAGMRWTDEINSNTARYDVVGNSYEWQWSIESCRRLVATSCQSRTGRYLAARITPVSALPLMQTTMKGRLGEAIVIMAGYDDVTITSAIDQIMTEARVQGVSKVFWLNYRLTTTYNSAYQGYYTKHNNDLENAKTRWPNLVVLDWNSYSQAQTSWFTPDGIHFTATGATALANYIKSALDSSDIASCVAGNANAGVTSGPLGTPPPLIAPQTGYTPIGPTRVLDTRDAGNGGGNGRLRAERTITVDLDAQLPGDAEAAVLNVTAVTPCNIGFLTVFACGTRPNTSNVNYVAGRTTAGMVISPMTDDQVCIHTSANVDVVVDLIGTFAPGDALFHPFGPTRWVDTRGLPALLGELTGQLDTGTQIDIPVAGVGDVPANASAAWVNLTATRSPSNAVLQLYPGPCGVPPTPSTVNVLGHRSAANAAIVRIGANGGICVRAFSGAPHVIVDISGWFGGPNPGGLALQIAAPQRAFDTRPGPPPAAGTVFQLDAAATTVLNVTSVNSAGFGFVAAIPCGSSSNASLLNNAPTEPVANLAAVAPGSGPAAICISPQNFASDLVVDVAGTFVTPS